MKGRPTVNPELGFMVGRPFMQVSALMSTLRQSKRNHNPINWGCGSFDYLSILVPLILSNNFWLLLIRAKALASLR